MLSEWLETNYEAVKRPPTAQSVARQFLLDQHRPADPQSVRTVVKQLFDMDFLLGLPGLNTPTRLQRKTQC